MHDGIHNTFPYCHLWVIPPLFSKQTINLDALRISNIYKLEYGTDILKDITFK